MIMIMIRRRRYNNNDGYGYGYLLRYNNHHHHHHNYLSLLSSSSSFFYLFFTRTTTTTSSRRRTIHTTKNTTTTTSTADVCCCATTTITSQRRRFYYSDTTIVPQPPPPIVGNATTHRSSSSNSKETSTVSAVELDETETTTTTMVPPSNNYQDNNNNNNNNNMWLSLEQQQHELQYQHKQDKQLENQNKYELRNKKRQQQQQQQQTTTIITRKEETDSVIIVKRAPKKPHPKITRKEEDVSIIIKREPKPHPWKVISYHDEQQQQQKQNDVHLHTTPDDVDPNRNMNHHHHHHQDKKKQQQSCYPISLLHKNIHPILQQVLVSKQILSLNQIQYETWQQYYYNYNNTNIKNDDDDNNNINLDHKKNDHHIHLDQQHDVNINNSDEDHTNHEMIHQNIQQQQLQNNHDMIVVTTTNLKEDHDNEMILAYLLPAINTLLHNSDDYDYDHDHHPTHKKQQLVQVVVFVRSIEIAGMVQQMAMSFFQSMKEQQQQEQQQHSTSTTTINSHSTPTSSKAFTCYVMAGGSGIPLRDERRYIYRNIPSLLITTPGRFLQQCTNDVVIQQQEQQQQPSSISRYQQQQQQSTATTVVQQQQQQIQQKEKENNWIKHFYSLFSNVQMILFHEMNFIFHSLTYRQEIQQTLTYLNYHFHYQQQQQQMDPSFIVSMDQKIQPQSQDDQQAQQVQHKKVRGRTLFFTSQSPLQLRTNHLHCIFPSIPNMVVLDFQKKKMEKKHLKKTETSNPTLEYDMNINDNDDDRNSNKNEIVDDCKMKEETTKMTFHDHDQHHHEEEKKDRNCRDNENEDLMNSNNNSNRSNNNHGVVKNKDNNVHNKITNNNNNNNVQQSFVVLPYDKVISGVLQIILSILEGTRTNNYHEKQQKQKIKMIVYFPTTALLIYYTNVFKNVLGRSVCVIHSKMNRSQQILNRKEFNNYNNTNQDEKNNHRHHPLFLLNNYQEESIVLFTTDEVVEQPSLHQQQQQQQQRSHSTTRYDQAPVLHYHYPNVTHVIQVGRASDVSTYLRRLHSCTGYRNQQHLQQTDHENKQEDDDDDDDKKRLLLDHPSRMSSAGQCISIFYSPLEQIMFFQNEIFKHLNDHEQQSSNSSSSSSSSSIIVLNESLQHLLNQPHLPPELELDIRKIQLAGRAFDRRINKPIPSSSSLPRSDDTSKEEFALEYDIKMAYHSLLQYYLDKYQRYYYDSLGSNTDDTIATTTMTQPLLSSEEMLTNTTNDVIRIMNAFAVQSGLLELPRVRDSIIESYKLQNHPELNIEPKRWESSFTSGTYFDVGTRSTRQ